MHLLCATLALISAHAENLCGKQLYDNYEIETTTGSDGRLRFSYCSTFGARHCSRVGKKEWYKRAELETVFQNWLLKRPDVQVYIGPNQDDTLGAQTLGMLSLASNRVGYSGVDALPLRENDPESARILALGSALSSAKPGVCRRFDASSDAVRRALEEALARATLPGASSNLMRP